MDSGHRRGRDQLIDQRVFLRFNRGPTKAGVFEGFPDMIVCDFPGDKIVAYIDRVLDDGGAVYKAPSGQFATVDPDGILHRENLPDCDGKSLTQLGEEGKTFDFSR